MSKSYNKDYFEDRKLKYEKNHGKFIHDFMFTEFSNRILGQCNVALNDLQRQLDEEIARATAEEKRLDEKIDTETSRAKTEEVRLDGKIDTEINRATARENELSTNITTIYSEVQDNIYPDVNKIKNNINKVLKYSNLYYSSDYDINEIDDNNKINYPLIMLNPDGRYVTSMSDGRPLNTNLNSTFAIIVDALNEIKTRLHALDNK